MHYVSGVLGPDIWDTGKVGHKSWPPACWTLDTQWVHRSALILTHTTHNADPLHHKEKKKWPSLSNSSPWFLCFISPSLFYWSSFSWPILTMMMLETTYWCYQNFDCLLHFLSFSYNSSFSYRVLWSFVSGLDHLWDYWGKG